MSSHRIPGAEELEANCLMRVEVGGIPLCLARMQDGEFAAIDDICTHEEQSLSDGDLEGSEVECPAHGSRFDLRTGEPSGFPADRATNVYKVTVVGDDVLVELP